MNGSGIVFTLFTGLVWTAVGICFSTVARRGIDFIPFMLVYSLCMTLCAWVVFPDYNNLEAVSKTEWLIIAATMLPYGLLGMSGFYAVRSAMRCGHHGIVWALAQSAVVFPFLFAVIVFGERISGVAWSGFALLLLGICGLSFLRKDTSLRYNSRWIWLALTAFLLIGISQIFSMLPNRFALSEAAQSLRIPFMVSVGLVWIVPALWQRSRFSQESIRFGGMYAALVLSGQFGVFKALDAMSASGNAALVYPLAIGGSIAMFFLYSRSVLREKAGTPVFIATLAVVAGVVLMAYR